MTYRSLAFTQPIYKSKGRNSGMKNAQRQGKQERGSLQINNRTDECAERQKRGMLTFYTSVRAAYPSVRTSECSSFAQLRRQFEVGDRIG